LSDILIVNPDPDERKALAAAIASRGRQVGIAGNIQEALHALARQGFDQIVAVRTLPDGSGELLAQQARLRLHKRADLLSAVDRSGQYGTGLHAGKLVSGSRPGRPMEPQPQP
jgi:DNA-binding response OmpR family regulator